MILPLALLSELFHILGRMISDPLAAAHTSRAARDPAEPDAFGATASYCLSPGNASGAFAFQDTAHDGNYAPE